MTPSSPADPHTATIAITGGTGSFGAAFARFLLAETSAKVRLISRDEHKQLALMQALPPSARLTYILADIRDGAKLAQAFDGADAVVHAAALKVAPMGERHADEFVKTNVYGSQNVIEAALARGVRRTLLISSDKATSAYNAYGKTKATAEALFVQANALGTSRGCRFAAVRGGNVWGSKGSVAEVWRAARAAGRTLLVYGPVATRFHLPMPEWTRFCWRALTGLHGGEIFAPKARAWSLLRLAQAFAGPAGYALCPPRDGDKLHEWLYSPEESGRTVDAGWAFVIEPPSDFRAVWNYQPWDGAPVPAGLPFSSETAELLSADELAALAQGV